MKHGEWKDSRPNNCRNLAFTNTILNNGSSLTVWKISLIRINNIIFYIYIYGFSKFDVMKSCFKHRPVSIIVQSLLSSVLVNLFEKQTLAFSGSMCLALIFNHVRLCQSVFVQVSGNSKICTSHQFVVASLMLFFIITVYYGYVIWARWRLNHW